MALSIITFQFYSVLQKTYGQMMDQQTWLIALYIAILFFNILFY